MKTSEIFRFVTTRPIQKADEISLQENFIYSLDPTPLLNSFRSGTASLEVSAQEYMQSDNFLSGFDHPNLLMQQVKRLHHQVIQQPNLSTQQFIGFASGIFGSDFLQSEEDEALANLEIQLWDSLMATVIRKDLFQRDRAEIIAALCLLNLLNSDRLRELPNKTLRKKLAAKAVLPKDVYTRDKGSPPATGDPVPNPMYQDVLDSINKLDQEIDKLTQLNQTLEFEERKQIKTYQGQARVIEQEVTEIDTPGTDGQQTQVILKEEVDDRNQMWMLSEEAVNNLEESQRNLLKVIQVDPAFDDTRFIRQRVNEEITSRMNVLHQTFGIRSVTPVGSGLVSQHSKKSGARRSFDFTLTPHSGGLQDPHVHLDDVLPPWAGDSYTHSIYTSLGSVRPLGMGDLLVVEESLLKYELGEIAHIENVLESETKERVHRRLDRQEETFTTATETTEESERDLQTTDRYELQRESQKTIESQSSFETGATFSAKYGPVSISADANYSTSNSQSEANSFSSTYAKEIVDKTVSRISESIKEELITQTLLEIEETNTHGFDNTHGEGEEEKHNIVGIYRWVDKYHQAQVYCYGQRLMMEFYIPEPAALYVHSKLSQPNDQITLTPPKPLEPDFSFESIKVNNYHTWVRDYQVQGVKPPPPQYTIITTALEEMMTEKPIGVKNPSFEDKTFFTLTVKTDKGLTVPEGYVADGANVIALWKTLDAVDVTVFAAERGTDSYAGDEDWEFKIIVGKRTFDKRAGETYHSMNEEDGNIPIAVKAFNILTYAFTVEIICKRTPEKLDEWRIDTYSAILDAYNAQQAAYDAEVKAALTSVFTDFGTNPLLKRKIEVEELKRGCITLLSDQHFHEFDAVERNAGTHGYPEINVAKAMAEGDYVAFFEQFVEWDQMVYLFYPYYWGNKAYWMDLMNRTDDDYDFEAFLRAGYARVVVPVRDGEGFVDSVLHYLETGDIWQGGDAPVINDPDYLSIIDEIKSRDGLSGERTPIDEPWEVVLPTSLVMLQEGSELPDFSAELNGDAES